MGLKLSQSHQPAHAFTAGRFPSLHYPLGALVASLRSRWLPDLLSRSKTAAQSAEQHNLLDGQLETI